MTEKKRIRIESNGQCYREGDTRIFIDGDDVSHQVSDVAWSIGAHHGLNLAKATITFTGVELAVEYVAEELAAESGDDKQRPRCRCMPTPSPSPAVPLGIGTRAGALAAQLERLRNALRREEA